LPWQPKTAKKNTKTAKKMILGSQSAKNREPRKSNYLGCQPPRIIVLAVWPPSKIGTHQNCKQAKKMLQPPRIQLFLAGVDSHGKLFTWRAPTAKKYCLLGRHLPPSKCILPTKKINKSSAYIITFTPTGNPNCIQQAYNL